MIKFRGIAVILTIFYIVMEFIKPNSKHLVGFYQNVLKTKKNAFDKTLSAF